MVSTSPSFQPLLLEREKDREREREREIVQHCCDSNLANLKTNDEVNSTSRHRQEI